MPDVTVKRGIHFAFCLRNVDVRLELGTEALLFLPLWGFLLRVLEPGAWRPFRTYLGRFCERSTDTNLGRICERSTESPQSCFLAEKHACLMLLWLQTSIALHFLKIAGLMTKAQVSKKASCFPNRALNMPPVQMIPTPSCSSQTEVEGTIFQFKTMFRQIKRPALHDKLHCTWSSAVEWHRFVLYRWEGAPLLS